MKKHTDSKKRKPCGWQIGAWAIVVVGLIALAVGCTQGIDPLGEEGGKGEAKVKIRVGSIGYAEEPPATKGLPGLTGEREAGDKETRVIPTGDGETVMECTLEQVPEIRTKATDMATGIEVMVFFYKASDDSYAASGAITTGSDDGVWLEVGETYKVRAVSYNSATAPNSTTVANAALGSAIVNIGGPAANDVLYAAVDNFTPTIVGDNDLALTFYHRWSLITVVADNSSANQAISACTATLTPGRNNALLNLNNGSLTNNSTPDVAETINWTISTAANSVTSQETRVYTGGTEMGLQLHFTSITVGSVAKTNTPVITFNKALAPGNKYQLTVKFKKPIPEVTIGNLTWVKANLYETSASGTYELFANEYEYRNSSGNWSSGNEGAYWNWGAVHPRTDYQSYSTGDGTASGTLANTTYWAKTPITTTTDPCNATLGGTWRLPTRSDINTLITTSVWTSGSSGYGSTAGRWFGTSAVPATDAARLQYVFLPAAGYRFVGSTTINYVGEMGYYYTSTPFETVTDPRASYVLRFWDTDVQVNSIGNNGGRSVRCVRNN